VSDPIGDDSANRLAGEFVEALSDALLLPLVGSADHARHSVIAVRLARGAAGVVLDALDAVRRSGARQATQESAVIAFTETIRWAKLERLRGLIAEADGDGEPLIPGDEVAARMRELIAEDGRREVQIGPDAALLDSVAAHYDDLAVDAAGISPEQEASARRRADELRSLAERLADAYAGQADQHTSAPGGL